MQFARNVVFFTSLLLTAYLFFFCFGCTRMSESFLQAMATRKIARILSAPRLQQSRSTDDDEQFKAEMRGYLRSTEQDWIVKYNAFGGVVNLDDICFPLWVFYNKDGRLRYI